MPLVRVGLVYNPVARFTANMFEPEFVVNASVLARTLYPSTAATMGQVNSGFRMCAAWGRVRALLAAVNALTSVPGGSIESHVLSAYAPLANMRAYLVSLSDERDLVAKVMLILQQPPMVNK